MAAAFTPFLTSYPFFALPRYWPRQRRRSSAVSTSSSVSHAATVPPDVASLPRVSSKA